MNKIEDLNLSENTEDYLEAIFQISNGKGRVRITDIAEKLGIKNPSVTQQIQKLSSLGLVLHESYGNVTLTKKGRLIGQKIDRRHTLFMQFLKAILFIPSKTAEDEACRFEHAVSKKTVESFQLLSDFLSQDSIREKYIEFLRERGNNADR